MEQWVYGLLGGFGGALVTALCFGFWIARNFPTTTDLEKMAKAIFDQMKSDTAGIRADVKEIEGVVKDDRHSARSNMDQRSEILLEKIDLMRTRNEASMEKIHALELRLTRVEAKQNGK